MACGTSAGVWAAASDPGRMRFLFSPGCSFPFPFGFVGNRRLLVLTSRVSHHPDNPRDANQDVSRVAQCFEGTSVLVMPCTYRRTCRSQEEPD